MPQPAAGKNASPAALAPLPGSAPRGFWSKPSAWEELALTLPVFLGYHLGVVFLDVKNATDFVYRWLMVAANGSTLNYLLITALLAAVGGGVFAVLGRGSSFAAGKFVQVACEGTAYAIVGRVLAGYVVGRLFAGRIADEGRIAGLIMSLGAGLYEEIAFRVVLFGLGLKAIVWFWYGHKITLVGPGSFAGLWRMALPVLGWALIVAAAFSGIHYVGALSDAFQLKSFLFRFTLGLFFCFVYITRGFAAAVWTHAIYDIWVLVIR
jgi:hypothetical protein